MGCLSQLHFFLCFFFQFTSQHGCSCYVPRSLPFGVGGGGGAVGALLKALCLPGVLASLGGWCQGPGTGPFSASTIPIPTCFSCSPWVVSDLHQSPSRAVFGVTRRPVLLLPESDVRELLALPDWATSSSCSFICQNCECGAS